MTENESLLLFHLTNTFCVEFSKIVADAINQCPKHLQDELKDQLSDHANVSSCNYQKYLS